MRPTLLDMQYEVVNTRSCFSFFNFWQLVLVGFLVEHTTCEEVTFGSMPAGCTMRKLGGDLNAEEMLDCQDANYNEIPYTSIPCDTKRINFGRNNFTKITRDSFRGLQQLEEIVLANNRISYIEAEAFAGLPNLRTVSLVENELVEIDERPFWRGQYNNLMLSVDGNPWFCDEHLKETVEALYVKVSFIGLICRGGFIRGIRGTIVGREFEDIRDRIENDLESWEIALIVSGCCGFVVLVLLVLYGIMAFKNASATAEYEAKGTKENDRYLDNRQSNLYPGSDEDEIRTPPSPVNALNDRKIHMTDAHQFSPDRSSDNGQVSLRNSPQPPQQPQIPMSRLSGQNQRATPSPIDRNSVSSIGRPYQIDSPLRASSPRERVESPPPPRPPPAQQLAGIDESQNMEEIHV